MNKIELIKADMDQAMIDIRRSLDWYEFKIIPLMNKYNTLIDGNFNDRTWYFVLKDKQ